jgi:lipoprotein-anchoring transpeptidase ErfK/SrfK
MAVDYYSLLTKAVAGKDAVARDIVYRDARSLIGRSNLTRQAASSHRAALEEAIRQIEDNLTIEQLREEDSAVAVSRVLSPGVNLKPLAITACAFVAVIALAAVLYQYVAGPRIMAGGVTASSRQTPAAREDVVMADLRPGVDGGSSGADLPFALQRQVVFYRTTVIPGSIVVDRENRFLYLIDSNNSARRYGIGIAEECLKGGSLSRVTSKLEWPDWRPTGTDAAKDTAKDTAKEPATLLAAAGRPGSALGARAFLLDKPGLIIHGTNSPKTIGHLVASGCIRLVNDDVEDLYRRVSLETRVIFVS